MPAGGGDDFRVEQLAQLDAAQQFGQQRGVQGQRRSAALGQRAVALVHERADIAEQQRRRERRRRGGLGLQYAHFARGDVGHQPGQRRYVVDVLQAFADRLQHDREVRIFAGHVEQLRGALALMPQRRSAAGMPPRQQQGTRRALPESGGEQRRTTHFCGDDRVDLVGVEDEQFGTRWLVGRPGLGEGVRQSDHDAVVRGGRLLIYAVAVAQSPAHRECERAVYAQTIGGVQDHPPVAQFVAEPLD